MKEDGVRDLLKGFAEPVVPAPDPEAARSARVRALPRIEASLAAVAAGQARRRRTRRIAALVGLAATLVLGVASAAAISRFGSAPAPLPVAPPAEVASAPVVASAPAPPPVAAPEPSVIAETPPVAPAPRVNRAPKASAEPSRPAAPESTLADQNRLLASALEARKRGDDGRALAALDQLLAKYPSSPLAEEARIERLRCLERLGQHGAPKR